MDLEEQTTLVSFVDHFKRPVTLVTVVLALGCATLRGGQSVAVRLSVEDIPPLTVIFLRLLLATVTLAIIAILGRQPLRVNRRQALFLFGNSLFLATTLGLFTLGTSLTSSVRSIVLINTFPLFAAITCHWFLPGFGLTRQTIIGLSVAVAGVSIVFLDQLFIGSATDPSNWRGDLLVLAGGIKDGTEFGAVLMGGAAGVFADDSALEVPLTFEHTRDAGTTMGSGAIIFFDDSTDFGPVLRRIAQFFRDESCGQCVPCRIGTVRQEETLTRLASGKTVGSASDELQRLNDLAQVMTDASICGLGQTAASAIQSAMKLGLA